MAEFPVERIRQQFPALNIPGNSIFFDNAAGAQIPRQVLDTVTQHFLHRNVQRGGRYRESRDVDAAIDSARESVSVFLNAADFHEVAFGINATSFIRLISLAIGQSLGNRREIVVTDADHEANIAAWLAMQRENAQIRWWMARDDGQLYVEDLEPLLSSRTRLVACTVASNAIGTIVDVATVAQRAHAAGAELFLDCVHYAPHGPIDVQAWGCDYLVCSGYKIFAPHMGFLWGRREILAALPTYREAFIPDLPPWKLEAGTFAYENVAGMSAAVEYIEELNGLLSDIAPAATRRQRLTSAMESIREYESRLSRALVDGLRAISGVTVYGVQDTSSVSRRVPTVGFNLKNVAPAEVTTRLASHGIAVRDGHMYSPRLMKRLGASPESGIVRASLVHYNTQREIGDFLRVLSELAGG